MRHITLSVLLFTLFLGMGEPSRAAAPFPSTVNLQTLLRDADGTLVQDPFADLSLRLTTADGAEIYQEKQPQVQVIQGAVNVNIGEGQVGGIPWNAFDPSQGPVFLEVQIGGNTPAEPIEFTLTPYAAYAHEALHVSKDGIGSEEIRNGSIKLEDLDQTLSLTSHPATAITIEGPFSFSPGTNVQNIIKDLDAALLNEVANRKSLQSAFNRLNFTGWDTSEGNDFLVDGSRPMSGNLNMGGHELTNIGNVDGVDVGTLADNVTNLTNEVTILKNVEPPSTDISTYSGQISEQQVPQFMRPFAFGTLVSPGAPQNQQRMDIINAHNINPQAFYQDHNDGSACFLMTFTNPPADAAYVFFYTEINPARTAPAANNAYIYSGSKTTTGIELCNVASKTTGIDFIVYKN